MFRAFCLSSFPSFYLSIFTFLSFFSCIYPSSNLICPSIHPSTYLSSCSSFDPSSDLYSERAWSPCVTACTTSYVEITIHSWCCPWSAVLEERGRSEQLAGWASARLVAGSIPGDQKTSSRCPEMSCPSNNILKTKQSKNKKKNPRVSQ